MVCQCFRLQPSFFLINAEPIRFQGTLTMTNSVTLLFATFLLTASSVCAHAASAKIYRIGFLGGTLSTRQGELKPFTDRLRELGYVESKNFTLELRFWEGKAERAPPWLPSWLQSIAT
jgi:hypothetical protein